MTSQFVSPFYWTLNFTDLQIKGERLWGRKSKNALEGTAGRNERVSHHDVTQIVRDWRDVVRADV